VEFTSSFDGLLVVHVMESDNIIILLDVFSDCVAYVSYKVYKGKY